MYLLPNKVGYLYIHLGGPMSLTEPFSNACESFAQEAFTINYTLAKNPELSSREFKSVKTIGAVLEKHGIPVTYEFEPTP